MSDKVNKKKLIPISEALDVFSFGLLAIQDTTKGLQKSLESMATDAQKKVIDKKIADKRLAADNKKLSKERFLELGGRKADSTDPKSAVKKSQGGFLQRIMTVLASIFTGWFLTHFPKIVTFIEQLMPVVKAVFKTVSDLLTGLIAIGEDVGALAGEVVQAMRDGDWLDSDGEVRDKWNDLAGTIGSQAEIFGESIQGVIKAVKDYAGDDSTRQKVQDEVIRRFGAQMMGSQEPIEPTATGGQTEKVNWNPILDMIGTAQGDSRGGGYDSVGQSDVNVNLQTTSLEDVVDVEGLMGEKGEYGRYGLTKEQIEKGAQILGLTKDDPFSAKNQDAILAVLLEDAGVTPSMIRDKPTQASGIINKMFPSVPVISDLITKDDAENQKITINQVQAENAFATFKRLNPKPGAGDGSMRNTPGGKLVSGLGVDYYGKKIVLNPDAAAGFKDVSKAAAADGVDLASMVTSSYRTPADQRRLIANANDPNVFMPAPVDQSPHVQGWAIDIAADTPEWEWMIRNGSKYKWRWRGDVDPVHFDYMGGNPDNRHWLKKGNTEWMQSMSLGRQTADMINKDPSEGEIISVPMPINKIAKAANIAPIIVASPMEVSQNNAGVNIMSIVKQINRSYT